MIPRRSKSSDNKPGRPAKAPLEVQLTVRFNFGAEPEDAITVMNKRRLPMVNSVFANRDRIVRGFVTLLLRSGMRSPAVAREIMPLVKLLRRGRT